MGWGTLYEVSDDAKQLLSTCRKKADWYRALDALGIESCPQLDAEDSIRFWASKLQELSHPAVKFFAGELHAEYDEFDDPNAVFSGNKLTCFFLTQLDQLGKQFFVDLFPHNGPYSEGESWLYEPLREFLHSACERDNGVVILWEN